MPNRRTSHAALATAIAVLAVVAVLCILVPSAQSKITTAYYSGKIWWIDSGFAGQRDPVQAAIIRTEAYDQLAEAGAVEKLRIDVGRPLDEASKLAILQSPLPRLDLHVVTGRTTVIIVYVDDSASSKNWKAYLRSFQ